MAARQTTKVVAERSDVDPVVVDVTDAALDPTGDHEALDVRLRLIQGFELTVNGRPIDLALGSQRMLAVLAVHDRPIKRNFVAFTLWIDKSEQRASANLRAALWRLRRLGLGLVESTASHLELGRDVFVDSRSNLEKAQAALASNEAPSEEAIASLLRDGDLLPDWYEDWVVAPRERLRQLRLHALEVMCARLIEAGRLPEAIDVGLAAVAAEPLRESAHRVLMQAHIAEGNHAEALRQYEAYRFRVHNEIGILPSERMEQLVGGVRNPALRTKGGPA